MDAWTLWVLQSLNALAFASLLMFITLGLTLIFGIMRIVNFAHGAIYMLGAYSGVAASHLVGNFWLGLLAAPLAAGMVGWVFERVALRWLYARDGGSFLLVTFGLGLVLTEAIRLLWGAKPREIALPPFLDDVVFLWGEAFPIYRLFLILAGTIVIVALCFVFLRTRLGLIIRATSQNAGMVHALGIDIHAMRRGVFCAGCGLAGLGGFLAAPLLTAHLAMGSAAISDAYVIVMIGGMGSLVGSGAASLLVGVTQTFGNFYWPEITLGATYVLMIIVLMIRPGGLFGEEE
jgi:branched-chain amino acid transport system permease protein